MKFSEDYNNLENVITRYGTGFIEINQTQFKHSILVFPDSPTAQWDCDDIGSANSDNLLRVKEFQPEVLIIGSGATFGFPDFELQAWLQQQGIGCETMDSAAACRTYNVLLAERRKVVAALLLP